MNPPLNFLILQTSLIVRGTLVSLLCEAPNLVSRFVVPLKFDFKWLKYGQNIHIANHSFIQIEFIQLLYLSLAYSILD